MFIGGFGEYFRLLRIFCTKNSDTFRHISPFCDGVLKLYLSLFNVTVPLHIPPNRMTRFSWNNYLFIRLS